MALNLGVTGFVQNKSDGSVSMEIEGEPEAVSQMIDWCNKGPVLARVSDVEITKENARNFVSFDIRK